MLSEFPDAALGQSALEVGVDATEGKSLSLTLLISFEQFHRVPLLLDHLGGLLGFRADHVIAVAAKVVHDLVVPEEQVADDRFDDAGLDVSQKTAVETENDRNGRDDICAMTALPQSVY
jgi:hypothetical protein